MSEPPSVVNPPSASVRGRMCPYSQWLPYSAELQAEATRSFEDLRQGLTEALVKVKIPSIKYWCRYLEG